MWVDSKPVLYGGPETDSLTESLTQVLRVTHTHSHTHLSDWVSSHSLTMSVADRNSVTLSVSVTHSRHCDYGMGHRVSRQSKL